MIAWVLITALAVLAVGGGYAGLVLATDPRSAGGLRSVGWAVFTLAAIAVYMVVQLAAWVAGGGS